MLFLASPAFGEVEFYMTSDRQKVGTEDTFHVDIVVSNAPQGAVVQFPAARDFEVLSRGESTQMSYSVGSGGTGSIKQMLKYSLVMRANRTGRLTIPPAGLQAGGKQYQTEALTIEVVRGRLGPDPRARRPQPQSPFGLPPGFPSFDDDEGGDPFGGLIPDQAIPRSDSDLFMRTTVDKKEVYVGEQVSLAIKIYSRIDLSSVDTVTMPKLEGFWSQDVRSPTQLTPEQRIIGGVPYREYVLREKLVFPMKPGDYSIEPTEADITTGFLFAGRKVHRKSNALKLKVKPLPPGGEGTNVGSWRLSMQVNPTDVTLGDPVQVRLILEGRGNLQSVVLPPLGAPKSFRVFDPQTNDKTESTRGKLGGTRTVEYVTVPQQTGSFTIPGMSLPYFDPESGVWAVTRTDPVDVTVRPNANGQQAVAVPGNTLPFTEPGPKNLIAAGGMKSLRHQAHFEGPRTALWSRPFFVPLAVAPALLALLAFVGGALRNRLSKDDPQAARSRQARAARKRLAGAQKLMKTGSPATFYAEVERALSSFLDAKLNASVAGLTRPELDTKLTTHGVAEDVRQRILAVLELCDTGRYAPGMGEPSARQRAVDDAAHAMEAFP